MVVKTIEPKLQYEIRGSTTLAIANLIFLANIGPKVKCHFHLPLLLVLRSYQKKKPQAMYYKRGGLR